MGRVEGQARNHFQDNQRGVALLAVLWLTVALSMMALATSYLVRTEVEAASNQIEAQRSYYLARGGIEAAIFSIARSSGFQAANSVPEVLPGQRWLRYEFPGGSCAVEIVPENAKLNVNQAPAEQLAGLFASLGLSPERSLELTAAIEDWRSLRTSGVGTPLDLYYAGLPQPYPARHAPLEQLEELLPVKGMDRSLFFGHVERNDEGRWQKWPPLADLLTTEPTFGAVNPNYAAYEVLRTLPGWSGAIAAAVVAARNVAPFRSLEELQSAVPELSAVAGLGTMTFAQGPSYALTATGFLPDSKVRRTVRVLVRVAPALPLYHRVLAWWDDWPSPNEPPSSNPPDPEVRSRLRL